MPMIPSGQIVTRVEESRFCPHSQFWSPPIRAFIYLHASQSPISQLIGQIYSAYSLGKPLVVVVEGLPACEYHAATGSSRKAVDRVRKVGGSALDITQQPYGHESACVDAQGVPFYLHRY